MPTPVSQIRSAAASKADLLDRYLVERDNGNAADRLGELVDGFVNSHARKIVNARLRRHGSAHDGQVEDVTSDTVVSFILYAEQLRQGGAAPIGNLEAFVAMLAARACNSYFRRVYPTFHGLRNRLRYLFEKYPELARWSDPESGEWICGLAEWRSTRSPKRTLEGVDGIEGLEWARGSRLHPADQLLRLFRQVGAPIRFNDLAVLMAQLWDVHELEATPLENQEFPDSSRSVDDTLDLKQRLSELWSRVLDLIPNQRAALLLNLKGADGSCGTSLLVATGTASIRQIAQAVSIPAAQFAALWERLPLEDLEIADLLGLSRQQIINLRKCARAKLARGNKSNK